MDVVRFMPLVVVACVISTMCRADPTKTTMTVKDDWYVTATTRRFNGRCVFPNNAYTPRGNYIVTLILTTPTYAYEDWSWNRVSQSPSGYWYRRSNKWAYKVTNARVTYDFQMSYIGTAPPSAYCVATANSKPVTTATTKSPVTVKTPVGSTKVTMGVNTDWPLGGGKRRFSGTCLFPNNVYTPSGSYIVILELSTPSFSYLDWSWDKVAQSPTGNWYKRSNKWEILASKSVVTYKFQLSYTGTAPPSGYCTATDNGKDVTIPPTQTTVTTAIPPTIKPGGKYDYKDVIQKSILFYAAQRSGKLPANNPISWRGDSALYDRGSNGEDLTGGWYDAADYVKFGFPMSAATTVLGWGLIHWEHVYKQTGLHQQMLDSIKWPLDYFIKCWRGSNVNVFYAQVGNGEIDHKWMGRPEDMKPGNPTRPAYKVTSAFGGSDVAGNTAAALAAGAIAFRSSDPSYSSTLLNVAKSLYKFADTYRSLYTKEVPDAITYYKSSSYKDELVYAAAMLYKATGDSAYLTDAENKYAQFNFDHVTSWAFDWDNKLMGAKLLLFEATKKSKYSRDVQSYLDQWRKENGFKYTPDGLAYRLKWGSLRYSANTAFIALVAASMGISPTKNKAWAESQIHYMLGDNKRSSSYVVGFGHNYPKQPHHKASVCQPAPAPCNWKVFDDVSKNNAHILYGALVGGPDENGNYVDKRLDYVMTEVACDYNAGFQSALAGLLALK